MKNKLNLEFRDLQYEFYYVCKDTLNNGMPQVDWARQSWVHIQPLDPLDIFLARAIQSAATRSLPRGRHE